MILLCIDSVHKEASRTEWRPVLMCPLLKSSYALIIQSRECMLNQKGGEKKINNENSLMAPTLSIRIHTSTGLSDWMQYSFGNPFARKHPARNIPVILSSIRTPLFSFYHPVAHRFQLRSPHMSIFDSDSLSPSPGPCALMSDLQSSATTTRLPPPLSLYDSLLPCFPPSLTHSHTKYTSPFHYDQLWKPEGKRYKH